MSGEKKLPVPVFIQKTDQFFKVDARKADVKFIDDGNSSSIGGVDVGKKFDEPSKARTFGINADGIGPVVELLGSEAKVTILLLFTGDVFQTRFEETDKFRLSF